MSAIGCMVPTSLLACITEIKMVSGVTARRTRGCQVVGQVPIEVEHTQRRHGFIREAALGAHGTHQAFGCQRGR
jgi:hypothetical protein